MLQIIISAGKSTRFTEKGYDYQKSLLKMPNGETLMEWQMKRRGFREVLYLSREEYREAEEPLIPSGSIKPLWIDVPTAGPVDALWVARDRIVSHRDVFVTFIDFWVHPKHAVAFFVYSAARAVGGSVVAFDDPNERHTRIPGTELACGGMYYFQTGRSLIERVEETDKDIQSGVSLLVYSFKNWVNFEVKYPFYFDVGTPEDYEKMMKDENFVS